MSLSSSCISAVLPWGFRIALAALALAPPSAAQTRRFTPADLWEWREILDARINSDASQVVYVERSRDRSSNACQTRLWLAAAGGGARLPLTAAGPAIRRPRWSPDGTRIAYLSGPEDAPRAGILTLAGHSERTLAAEGAPLTLAWSPDGRTLAYTARTLEPAPATGWAPPALLPELRQPHTRLFLVPAAGGASRPVPLGALEPVGEPAWMPGGNSLLLALAEPFDPDRPLEGAEIYSLHLPDFSLRRLTRHPGADLDPVPSPDGSRIAWIAREAAPQSYTTAKLWVANPDGSRARALAGALDRDPVQPAWSGDSRTVYFLADDRGQTRVWAARNDGSARPVVSAPRLRAFSLADNGRAVAVRDPEELITFPVDLSAAPVPLYAPDRELLAARAAGAVEPLEYRSGTRTIQAWLTRPPGFDPARRYPLLLDIEEPRRMCGADFRLRAQILAGAGLLVLCADARGVPGYGEAFGNLIRSGLPGDDFEDWMAGLDALAARPYIDPSRLAIRGGLAAAWAIGHTGRFHAAVARRPIADFALDAATAPDGALHAAAWMGGPPWMDPEQYWRHSPLYFAAGFRTPTLILAGEHDPAADELAFALRWRKVDSALVRFAGGRPADEVAELEAALAWLLR